MTTRAEKLYQLSRNTFRELARGKVLYIVFVFAIVVVLVSALFGSVTIGDQALVIKDFGLFSISLFSAAFAVIAGASLLSKELSKKTVYNILAKPVRRWEFLLGKFFGMYAITVLMVLLMGAALIGFVWILTGNFEGALCAALYFECLQLAVICAAIIFFSALVVTPVLAGLFTFGIFLIGRSDQYVLYFIQEGQASGISAVLLRGLYALLPHLSWLNVSNEAVFGYPEALTAARVLWSSLYALGYCGILVVLASAIFSRKQFT